MQPCHTDLTVSLVRLSPLAKHLPRSQPSSFATIRMTIPSFTSAAYFYAQGDIYVVHYEYNVIRALHHGA